MNASFTHLMQKAKFVFFFLFIISINAYSITTTCISSGAWTSSSTWDNGVPSSTVDVVVPSGYTVTMDGIAAQCKSLFLTGTITWTQARSTTVGSGGITMYNGAAITGSAFATGTLTSTGPLAVPSGAAVTIGKVTLNVTGSTTIYGGGAELTFSNINGTKSFADVTINSGGSWNSSVNEDYAISGNLTVNGSFTAGNGDYTFTGASNSIDGSTALTFGGLIINSGASITNNTSITVTSKLQSTSGTGTLTNAANKSLTIQVAAASYSLTTLVASSIGNTVTFSYNGDQTIPVPSGGSYHHLSFGGSSVKTLAGDITVNGNMGIAGSAELYNPAYTLTGTTSGTFTMASGTKLRLGNTSTTTNVVFPVFYSKSNISLDANSEVIYQAGGNQTVSCAPDYGHVTMSTGASSTTKTFNTQILTVKGDLTINSNVILDVNSDQIIASGNIVNSGSISMTTGEIDIAGSWSGSGTFTKGTSSVYYNGSADQTVKAQDYYYLVITNSGSSSTVDMSGSYTVSDELYVQDGTVTLGSITFNDYVTVDPGTVVNVAATTPIFNSNLYLKGTMNFTNTSGTKTFSNINVYSTGSWNNTSDANFSISGNIISNGTWVGSSGTGSTYYLTGASKSFSGSTAISMPRVNISASASYSNQTTLNISTELSGSGSFTNSSSATLNIGATSTSFSISTFNASATGNTVNFNRSGDQDMKVPSSSTFYHLTVSNGYKKSLASADITVNGNLTVSASTEFDCNNYQVTGNATGTLSVASGGQLSLGLSTDIKDILFPTNYTTANITLADGSTVLYRAQNDQTISCVPSYYNLTMQDGTGSSNRNLAGGTTLTVRNNLDLYNSSLTLVVGANTLDVNGTFSGVGSLSMTSGTFYLGGNFTNTGTFTYGTGTVVYDGSVSQTMRYTTYYNLTVNKTGGKIVIASGSGTLQVNNNFSVSNGTVELNTKEITVSGTTTISDTLAFTGGISPYSTFGDYVVASGGVHNNSSNSRTYFNGNFQVDGTYISGSQNQYFQGTGKTISGSSSISITDATITGSYTNNCSSLTLLALAGSGSLTNGANKVLHLSGANVITTFVASASGNTVDYNGSSSQSVFATTYHHLTITNNNSVQAGGVLTINGNFDNQGQFTASGYAISLSGNWNNDGIYTNTSNTITFNGTSDQSITGSSSNTFTNLIINKSSGKLTLSKASTVNGALTLTAGKIYTTTTNLLTLGSSATVSGASNNSYVEGPVAKIMATTSLFTFPTGKNGRYQSVSVTPASTSSVTFRAEYFDTTTVINPVGTGIHHVSSVEYFQVDRTSGSTNANVTLSWGSQSGVDGSALVDLRVAKWNGSQWIDMGQSSITGNGSSGTITSTVVTSFSPFKIASASSSNPLPVELISFEAAIIDNEVVLNWKTASETNNEYFSIERSIDGLNFSEIGKVEGMGNSIVVNAYEFIDANPYEGIAYYRFKQVDFNGAYEYSPVAAVNYESDVEPKIVMLTEKMNSSSLGFIVMGSSNQHTLFEVRTISGKLCHVENYHVSKDNEQVTLHMSTQLPSGIYFLVMHFANGKAYSQKLLIP